MDFENTVDDVQLGVEDQQEDLGPEELDEGENAGPADRQKPEQDHRFNAAMKAARQNAERDTAQRMGRETDERIAAMRIPNPAKPGSFFRSMEDLNEYSSVLRRHDAEDRAQKQGRSVEEIEEEDANRAYLSGLRAKDEAEAKRANAERQMQAWIAEDLQDFQQRYPDVDVAKLEGNKQFRRFAGSRYGKEPLGDLYDDFLAISGDAGKAAVQNQTSKAERSTGAGDGKSTGPLSAAQKRALKEWNENNPDMRMTEAEFAGR